jgi:hypothetical protein
VLREQLADAVFGDAAGFGDAGDLEIGGVGGDVGIEAGAGGGDQVNGNGLAGVLLGELVNGGLDAVTRALLDWARLEPPERCAS